MDLKIVSAVARALTANGANGYVRVAAGSSFKVGATVNLTSTAPLAKSGLQIQDIKGVAGSTDIALYLIDPATEQPFDASAYTTVQAATVTQPEQRLWYGITDEVPPFSPVTDLQMTEVIAAIFPSAVSPLSQAPATDAAAILTKSIIAGLNEDGAYQDAQILTHDSHSSFDRPGLAVRPVLDQYSLSAFSEQRVSVPFTLADIVQKYGRDTRSIQQSTNLGTVADTPSMSGFTLAVGVDNGAYAKARTNEWYRYQTGRGQQVVLSCLHSNLGQANQTRNWGYFDDADGLMFRLVGTTLNVVRRTSTGESGGSLVAPYEEVVAQSLWNVDKMDGLGHSGVDLDVTKGNIYEIRFQWLGVGVVQFFVNTHLVHQMVHPNVLAYPYMRTATLPLTWEVINTGVSGAGGFTAICGHVTSQSGQTPPFNVFAAVSGPRATTSAAELPLLSVRAKQLLNAIDNRVPILARQLSLSETGANRAYIIIRLNATLTGAVWNSLDAQSSAEFDIAATALLGGSIIARYALNSNGDRDIDLRDWFALGGRTVGRDAYSGVSDILTISVQRVAATNPIVDATLMFHEIH